MFSGLCVICDTLHHFKCLCELFNVTFFSNHTFNSHEHCKTYMCAFSLHKL